MKDDKNLSYIVISGGPVEEVYRTRQKPEKGLFFGPYTSQANISHTLRTLRQIFAIRSCRMKFGSVRENTPYVPENRRISATETAEKGGDSMLFLNTEAKCNESYIEGGVEKIARSSHFAEVSKIIITAKSGKTPPCLDYYIGLCPAPCLLTKETLDTHKTNVENLKKFLRGQMSDIITELREKMFSHAKKQEFEEAGKIKEQIISIELLGEKQIARDAISGSYDAVVLIEKYQSFFVVVAKLRNGEISGVFHTKIETKMEETKMEIMESYIVREYSQNDIAGLKILFLPESITEIAHLFLTSHGIEIEIPESGAKRELLKFTQANALGYAMRDELENLSKKQLTRSTMVAILEEIGYIAPKNTPIVFECYDNSHTNGQFTVAARTVILNGKSEPSMYRKYKLKTLEVDKIDDFESMREIMKRRIMEGFSQNNFPTLILIDGGKGQLSSALEGVERGLHATAWGHNPDTFSPTNKEMQELREKLPFFASLAKREEEVFVPFVGESFHFEQGSPELMLLQKIRDEAHRFSISFNRSLRSKAMKKNILEELPGFGPVTRKKLLSAAGSIDAIQEMNQKDLSQICSKTQIETLIAHGLWGGNEL